jgi:hypothetical protein
VTTLSVVAAAQPSNSPPRVQVTVTDTGSSPAITSATVTRTDNSGRTSIVRTPDGNPLPLVTSGSNRVGVVYDYEAPYGIPVTYSTSEQPANLSAAVTVVSSQVWLVHPGVPDRSIPVDFYEGTLMTETYAVAQGVFHPLGRTNAVVINSGARQAASSTLNVLTETLGELAALRALVADAGVLQLNIPDGMGLGFDTCYIAVADVVVNRLTDVNANPLRSVSLPFVVVDAPVGGTQAQWSWADVVAKYATWQQVINANATWAALQTQTS